MDSSTIAAIRAGDTEKFGLLYDAYFPRIYRYIFYRTRDKETAEDIVSTTFFKAVERLDMFDPIKGTFSAWLYRVARNTLYDHTRAKKHTEPLENAEAIPTSFETPGEAFDRKELVQKVRRLMDTLPVEQKEVISMRVWDELSYGEIAHILEKSEASCKMLFHRGIVKLRAAAY